MLLMIDNYDSFTYNLVQYFGELGVEVATWRNDQLTLEQIADMAPSHIVISPGPCDPEQAGISMPIIRHFGGKIPILGVCLGHQAIGAALGGQVVRAKTLMHGKTSTVQHDGQGVFKDIVNPVTVTRYHSLAIARDSLPADLVVSAWTDDGEIMGVRHRSWALEGVQFHPEAILTQSGHHMLRNFLEQTSTLR